MSVPVYGNLTGIGTAIVGTGTSSWYLPAGGGPNSWTTSPTVRVDASGNFTVRDPEVDKLQAEIAELKARMAKSEETAKEKENMPRLSDVRERTDLYLYDTAEFPVTKHPAKTETRTVVVRVPGHLGLGFTEEERTQVVEVAPTYETGLSMVRIFSGYNTGHREKSNMQVPGQLSSDAVAIIKSLEFSVAAADLESWSKCHWTLNVGCKDYISTPIAQLVQVSSSSTTVILGYTFAKEIVIAARQNFAVAIERFGDQFPQGQMKVALRGVLTRDCL